MSTEPRWMLTARVELGQREVPGAGDNPRIVEYHGATAAGAAPDEVAWCSSFCNFVLAQNQIPGTRSKSALSWKEWGVGVGCIAGAVCVLSYGGGKGHVGFVVGRTKDGKVVLLAGNQGNAVSIKAFPTTNIVGYRWPAPPVVDDPGAASSTR